MGEITRIEPENGRTLVLYLDRVVQHIIEKKLLDGIEKYGAKEGSVILMDPKTGEVLSHQLHFHRTILKIIQILIRVIIKILSWEVVMNQGQRLRP